MNRRARKHSTPELITFKPEGIPDELKKRDQWVVSKVVRLPDGKLTKPPLQVDGSNASTTDPRTWTTFAAALAAVRAGHFDYLGFVFTDSDPYVGIDEDGCRDPATGEIERRTMSRLACLMSYTEISVSGTGLHTIVRGKLPPGRREKGNHAKGGVGMYDAGRYFLLTGNLLDTAPKDIFERTEILAAIHAEVFPPRQQRERANRGAQTDAAGGADDEIILERARHARNGTRFAGLYDRGDWQGEGYASQSEADLGLCSMLAFYTGPDTARVDALFRRSALHRDKWDRGHYADETIARALERSEFYDWSRASRNGNSQQRQQRHDEPGNPTSEVRPPEFSDDALALDFVAGVPDLRYVADWGKWLEWTARKWQEEKTLKVFELVRRLCRGQARRAFEVIDKPSLAMQVAKQVASAKTVAAVAHLARSDRRIAAVAEQWDADPWSANEGGQKYFRAGDHLEHRPLRKEDYMTRSTAVRPSAGRPEKWLAWLGWATAGNQELIDFLQRAFGYCLLGDIGERVLFFHYGTGANGKSVFLRTLLGVVGDYGAMVPMEALMATRDHRHETELAMLRGVRLAVAVETERGQRWAESKIKALTGGEPITARFIRQDFFTFQPELKLMIAGNHKPVLWGVDNAIRSRVLLIPWAVTIPPEQQDKKLFEKFKAEWPQILRWGIDGCDAWLKSGLRPPRIVLEATEEYLDTQDALGRWIEERCEKVQVFTPTKELFADWRAWATEAGEYVGAQRAFSDLLSEHGYRRHHDKRQRGFIGLKPLEISREPNGQVTNG